MQTTRSAALSVDLSLLRKNVETVFTSLGGVGIIPVLKADAYGLGMTALAKTLAPCEQVCCFAVAQVPEGLTLRECGIEKPILVLGEALPAQIEAAIKADLSLTVGRVSDVESFARAAARHKKRARIQIKFDTGLHRIGVEETNFYALCGALTAHRDALSPEGAYSHFADPGDAALCERQFRLFTALCDRLEQAGFPVPLRHIADSAASERYPAYALDAVRLGRRLAWDAPTGRPFGTREIASLRAAVLDIRDRKAGDRLGYGDGLTLNHDARIAVLGIGYGDGLDPRMAQLRLPVLLHGTRCPILYCFMDQTLVDVTGVPAAIGDFAVLFGSDDTGAFLSAPAQANACGANEGCALTTALLPRVERVYYE